MCHSSWRHARVAVQWWRDFARLRRVRDRIDRKHVLPLNIDDHSTVIAGTPAETLGFDETPGGIWAAFDRNGVRAWIRLRAGRVLSYAAEGASK